MCYLFAGNQSDDDLSFYSWTDDEATYDMMQFAYGCQNQEDCAVALEATVPDKAATVALKATVAALAAIAVIMQ